jgi:hypothetical protein
MVASNLTPDPGQSLSPQRPTNGGEMHQAITIRRSRQEDGSALLRLAALDDRPFLRSDALLAFVDGELKAAVELPGGEAIADPFERTAELVELLRLRAAQTPTGERWAA